MSMLTKIVASLALTSAALGAVPAVHAAEGGKVLIVLSSADKLELKEGKKYQTGFYLDELSIPLKKIVDAGFEPVFANPEGNVVTFDPVSNDKVFFGGSDDTRADYVKLLETNKEFNNPKKLSDVAKEGTKDYVGVFIPGGHAPMEDLSHNKELGKILVQFHENARPTGIICHGPTALLSAIPKTDAFREQMIAGDPIAAAKAAEGWPYAGYRLTVFSTAEENMIEGQGRQLGGQVKFYAADALAQAGAHVDRVAAWGVNVIEDRELVSGQQPFSSDAFGDAFVAKLKASSL